MSKELLILRHAKSDWDSGVRTDFQRPLNKRGKRNKDQVAAFLQGQNLLPDLILTSTAVRARETALAIHRVCGDVPLLEHDALYLADKDVLFDFLSTIDKQYNRVMIVAHNPGLEDLVRFLIPRLLFFDLPTAGLVHIECTISNWKKIKPQKCRLIQFVKARDLDAKE